MRRVLAIGLTLLVSVAVLVGVRAGYRWVRFRLAASRAKPSAPIPQDAAMIEEHRRDLLAWNRRTLQELYDRVGKKDQRWDEPARKTLGLAARMFSGEVDPQVNLGQVYSAAKAAVDAGCDDPMLAYLHARASVGANDPGPREARRRAQVAARGLATGRYPAFRRAVAMCFRTRPAMMVLPNA